MREESMDEWDRDLAKLISKIDEAQHEVNEIIRILRELGDGCVNDIRKD